MNFYLRLILAFLLSPLVPATLQFLFFSPASFGALFSGELSYYAIIWLLNAYFFTLSLTVPVFFLFKVFGIRNVLYYVIAGSVVGAIANQIQWMPGIGFSGGVNTGMVWGGIALFVFWIIVRPDKKNA